MLHRDSNLGDQHKAHNWEYANAAARESASGFTSSDLKKLAYQVDDSSFWVLVATTPTWVQVGGGGGGGGGNVATDPIWEAVGDLAVGTGEGTAERLPMEGGSFYVLRSNGEFDGLEWANHGFGQLDAIVMIGMPVGYRLGFVPVEAAANPAGWITQVRVKIYVPFESEVIAPKLELWLIPEGPSDGYVTDPGDIGDLTSEGVLLTGLEAECLAENNLYIFDMWVPYLEGELWVVLEKDVGASIGEARCSFKFK